MTRQLIIAATFTVATIAAATAHAGCGNHGCQTYYGRYTAHEVYVVFQQHPELIARFPQIAQQLQTQFGAIQPAVVAAPAGQAPAIATPAVATIETPAVATTPAIVDPAPAAVPGSDIAQPVQAAVQTPEVVAPIANTTEIPLAAAPVETPTDVAAPEITDIDPSNVDPDAPPADLPFEEPPAGF